MCKPPRQRRRPPTLGLVAAALVVGCTSERETLLQLDVAVPATLAAAIHPISVEIGGQRRAFRQQLPDAGDKLGLDVPLPRRLVGDFEVWVRVHDVSGCVLAENSNWVVLSPGERSRTIVSLVALAQPSCDGVGDGGPPLGGDLDGGADADPDAPADATAEADLAPVDGGPGDGGSDSSRDATAPVDGTRDAGMEVRPPDAPAAPASCAEIKERMPAAGDGIYLVKVGAAMQRVYCDMAIRKPLCAETAGQRDGVTRDGSRLKIIFSSVLDPATGACRVWGVRNIIDGFPLDLLDGTAISTCQALGFKADHAVRRQCRFGANPGHTNCGFGIREFNKWANLCVGCKMNPGRHPHYVLQGRIFVSGIPWNADGSMSAFCKVQ